LDTVSNKIQCFHCGEECLPRPLVINDKPFCCEGCSLVYNLLNETGLCQYYDLNKAPGTNLRVKARKDKFSFLDDQKIRQQLVSFQDEKQVHTTLYLPQIHCSSCLWLLENLNRLRPAIISSKVNFPKKEITVIYNVNEFSLKELAELLSAIGYEPYFSLYDMQRTKPKISGGLLTKLGVAGFCFANIMLLSFPDYLGLTAAEHYLHGWFRILSLLLAIPVLLYSSQPFFISAAKSLAHKHLNIDAPIALAILVTFLRSAFEVLQGSGSGYFDSMSGIVFFMLAGRVMQEKTYQHLSFDRDYTSYFPVAVTILKDGTEIPAALPDIKPGDTLLIHNEELIPADGILTRGRAFIDYSFVTGESLPVMKEVGELVYAGGKQTGGSIEILVIKEVSQSYLTSLWNREDEGKQQQEKSFVHLVSRYFTFFVLAIAIVAGSYWQLTDPSKTWNAITAILIVACPCALLLSNSFTNGNVLRVLSRNGCYLKNACTIENIADVNHIVFDKTGTLTAANEQHIEFVGTFPDNKTKEAVAALSAQSSHPLSRAISSYLGWKHETVVQGFREIAGQGIEGIVNGDLVSLGSAKYISAALKEKENATKVYVAIEEKVLGYFLFRNRYRASLPTLLNALKQRFNISVLSGDNNNERARLQHLFGKKVQLLFNQKPTDKKDHIQKLKDKGEHVMMVGDGLNDAGALKESHVGIAVCENTNNFTPASDAILQAGSFHLLPSFIRLCKANKNVIISSFVFSIVYNVIGIYFAVQGTLSPLIAAILMPASSISILLLTFGATNVIAKRLKL
jgi:P-type Cu+ transporter